MEFFLRSNILGFFGSQQVKDMEENRASDSRSGTPGTDEHLRCVFDIIILT